MAGDAGRRGFGAFTALPAALSVGRYKHTAVTANDGRVLIYGGDTESGQAAPPELYDPATGRFSALAAPEGNVRENHSAVKASDGGIWIIGGDGPTESSRAHYFDTVVEHLLPQRPSERIDDAVRKVLLTMTPPKEEDL